MTDSPYEVIFTAKADHETMGLPDDAFEALIELLGAIGRAPWSSTFVDDPSDPALRWAPFGEVGMVLVHIDEDRRVVRVHGVTWTG